MILNKYRLKLRPVTMHDLELLRQWRNADPVRLNMRDQSFISKVRQRQWFEQIQQSSDVHFVAEYKETPIGYANFKKTGTNLAETGLYIGADQYRGTALAFCLALALLDFVFTQPNITMIQAHVLPHNTAAIHFNQKLGYHMVQQQADMIVMQLRHTDYLRAKKDILSVLRL